MNNIGTQNINTERLLLRRVKLDDAENMFAGWSNDKEIIRYMTWNAYDKTEQAKRFIAFCLEQNNTQEDACAWAAELAVFCLEQYETGEDVYRWTIELKEEGKAVGMIDVADSFPKIKAAQIEYALSRAYWSKGIMSEALTAVIAYLFENTDYNRIEAAHHVNNPASGKVMQKSGMRFEGIHRQGGVDNKGDFCDLAYYAILRSDISTRA